ncbi:MAG TPA: HIT family protein [Pyrinomonadaceae bacterium]|jgi:histidine triad (HIT) family protein|nr:HIT family protein [Pyrinomonadaceae bacterium]
MTNENCLFCRIVSGEVPATIIYEDDNSLAFLDHRPLFHGHTLLVPRVHVETLGELPVAQVGPFFKTTQLLASAIEPALAAEGTFVAMNNRVSQSVPHLHVHIVPRRRKDGLKGFFWPRTKYKSEDEMVAVKKLIAAEIAKIKSQ